MKNQVLKTYRKESMIGASQMKGGSEVNVRLLKAKRVELGLLQKDLAKALGITEKAMCQKECSRVNRFRADEMLTLAGVLKLTPDEFDAIFLAINFPNG